MSNKLKAQSAFLNIFHLPTYMLAVGLPMYWGELYFLHPEGGRTSLLTAGIFGLLAVITLLKERRGFCSWCGWIKAVFLGNTKNKWLFRIGALLGLTTLAITFYASLFPPHLIQEFDTLNYHIALPRQHLILGSFNHIPWSTADLYLFPIDLALAPYWLVTDLPNKFPQFLFFLSLILISMNLVKNFSKGNVVNAFLVGLAILGSHNMGIQMGTAMLDVVMCYLLVAALDSFLSGKVFLCSLELAFYFWSKSFIPVQFTLIVLIMGVLFVLLRKFGVRTIGWHSSSLIEVGERKAHGGALKKVSIYFTILSVFIAGPFLMKSLYNAGTPLYPFFIGKLIVNGQIDKNSEKWQSLVENTEKVIATKDHYGSGRSPKEFLRHLWLIAVPEKGVNNRYDYPVGLMYLLCLGPFLFALVQSIKNKQFLILPLVVAVFWFTWWLGSHQSRFLFVPILIMFIVVFSEIKTRSRLLVACMLIAMSLVVLSVFRAHKRDFGRSRYEVLREKDRSLIEMSKSISKDNFIQLDFYDVAFANFPVDVINNDSVFIINYRSNEK